MIWSKQKTITKNRILYLVKLLILMENRIL